MVVEEAMGAAKVQLVKWGNSHALRLPKSVLPQANIRGGAINWTSRSRMVASPFSRHTQAGPIRPGRPHDSQEYPP